MKIGASKSGDAAYSKAPNYRMSALSNNRDTIASHISPKVYTISQTSDEIMRRFLDMQPTLCLTMM